MVHAQLSRISHAHDGYETTWKQAFNDAYVFNVFLVRIGFLQFLRWIYCVQPIAWLCSNSQGPETQRNHRLILNNILNDWKWNLMSMKETHVQSWLKLTNKMSLLSFVFEPFTKFIRLLFVFNYFLNQYLFTEDRLQIKNLQIKDKKQRLQILKLKKKIIK